MNLMTTRPVLTVLALGLGTSLTLAGCGSAAMPVASPPTSAMLDKGMADKTTAMADKTMTDPMMTDKPSAMAKGTYVSYADYQSSMSMYQGSKVVLFFHAPWCPDCRATDAALAGSTLPDGLAVVKVDYDSMTELKQKYGITQQHTFVQVDASGTALKKWTGTKDAASIKGQTL